MVLERKAISTDALLCSAAAARFDRKAIPTQTGEANLIVATKVISHGKRDKDETI